MSRSLNLTVTSPAQSFDELFTLSEIKSFLNLPERSPADGEEDSMLTEFNSAAREIAEICQDRDFVRKQWDLTLDYFEGDIRPSPDRINTKSGGYVQPGICIELRDGLVSVDLVRYRDSDGSYHTLTEDTDYIVDTAKRPGLIAPIYGKYWPAFTAWPSSAVLIRFTTAPRADFTLDYRNRIKNGMRFLISSWFVNRVPFEAVRGSMVEYAFTVNALFNYGSIPRVLGG